MKKRVVITGMGVISALGNELDKFWNSIKMVNLVYQQ